MRFKSCSMIYRFFSKIFLATFLVLAHPCSIFGNAQEKKTCESYLEKIQEAECNKDFHELGHLYMELAQCYEDDQKMVRALDAYEMALQFQDLSLEERIKIAKYLGDLERDNAAIEELRRILEMDPTNQEALIAVAKFLTWRGKEGDQQAAEVYISQVLEKDPKNIEALLILGNVLNYSERSPAALCLFQEILVLKLSDEEAFTASAGLALAYINTLNFEAAACQIAQLKPELLYQEKLKNRLKDKLLAKMEEPKEKAQELRGLVQAFVDRAIYLSNKRCYEAAYWELYQALLRDPCNVNVRLALARTLGLDGYYCEALAQIEIVLAQDPCNVDAWITRGTVLRWKVSIVASTCAYTEALNWDPENFDALLGLAYTDLERDERAHAYQLMLRAHPMNEGQCREYAEIFDYLILGPIVNFDFFQFHDSDEIVTRDYLVDIGGYYRDMRLDLFYHHVDATQPIDSVAELSERVDAVRFDFLQHINAVYDLGAGIGFANTTEGDFITGNARANYRTGCGNFALGSVYDLYTLTAAAIFFEIRTWRNYISYVHKITGRWTVGGDYAYTLYSDSNRAHKIDFFAKYQFFDGFCWDLFVDYMVTYWDFKEQILTPFVVPGVFGGHGYFNPNDYFENLVGLTALFSTKKFDLYLRPYAAYVTYEQQGRHNGIYFFGKGDATYKFTHKISMGIGLEVGVYPLKNLHYDYTIVSAHARFAF